MMRYTYLLINLAAVFFPVALSFDKRVAFYKTWKYIWPGMGITGILFLIWDVLFTVKGVWSFNPKYILGITLFELPVEEVLFFLTVPFACIFIYACLNHYVKWRPGNRLVNAIMTGLTVFCVLQTIFGYRQLYTLAAFGTLGALLVLLLFVFKTPKWLGLFFMTYVVTLIPFYLINGLLTAIPVVLYNNAQFSGIRVGTIPFEDHFYCMALLLMNVGFYDWFKWRGLKGDSMA